MPPLCFVAAPLPAARRGAPLLTAFRPRQPVVAPRARRARIAMQAGPPPPYKLGLCLAGAASGGAYSAGVMDFLLEALAAWEHAKSDPSADVPRWDVAVTEIIGTSAGGINSTLSVNALNTGHVPLPRGYRLQDGIPPNNRLFQTWVQEFSYKNVFANHDFDAMPPFEKKVFSVLNANFIKDTVGRVLGDLDIKSGVPNWATDLYLSITSTNLRGVPYSIENFTDASGTTTKFRMRKHADYSQFRVTTDPSSVSDKEKRGARVLDLTASRSSASWKPVTDSSRATAAYPIGLPTVQLSKPKSEYEGRLLGDPDWNPELHKAPDFDYVAVDGGVMNNEPFGVLIQNMERRNGKDLDSHKKNAWGSVVLIDPFPSDVQDRSDLAKRGLPLVEAILKLFNATRGESSFKEEELKAALKKDSMEKFIIEPQRTVRPIDIQKGAPMLATKPIGSFAGILDPRIGFHDFMLGRLNCQNFLKNVLVMEKEHALENDIFKNHLDDYKGAYVPVIPLVGSAAEPVEEPQWPKFNDEKEKVKERVMSNADNRFDAVLTVYMQNLEIFKDLNKSAWNERIGHWAINQAAKLIRTRLRRILSDRFKNLVEVALNFYDD